MSFTLQWTLTGRDENKPIRDFLKEQEISKTALTDIKFTGGEILINDIPVTVRHLLREGEILTVRFPPEHPSIDLKAENIPIEIIYEDPYVLVVNKPPNLQSIPSRDNPNGSLANALLFYYQQTKLAATVHLVNRLDKDTSGLLLVAKHRHIHHLLSNQQRTGTMSREYEAIVHGSVRRESGTIDAPIGRMDDSIIKREVREDGQYAVTHYRVLSTNDTMSHLSLRLETGRTHQIRVHLSHFGHPIVGDDLYGGFRDKIGRQALHCCRLTFWHPFYKREIILSSTLPNDILQLVR